MLVPVLRLRYLRYWDLWVIAECREEVRGGERRRLHHVERRQTAKSPTSLWFRPTSKTTSHSLQYRARQFAVHRYSYNSCSETGPSRATAGPGKPFLWGPITTPICAEIETLKASAEGVEREKMWGGVSHHHLSRGLGSAERSPSGVQPKMDFMHIWGQKEAIWNTFLSIVEQWWGPQNAAGPGKTFPLSPPLDGPAQKGRGCSSREQWGL